MEAQATDANLGKYLLQFAGWNIVCAAIFAAITMLLKWDLPSSMGIVTLIAATGAVTQSFVNSEKRAMTSSERRRFALLGTLINLGLTVVGVLFLTMFVDGGAVELPIWTWVLVLAFAAAISWCVIYFIADFFSKAAVKRLQKS